MSSSNEDPKSAQGPSGAPDDSSSNALERREWMSKVGAGVVTAALGVPVVMSVRSLVPNALYEAPQKFKAGKPEQFAEGPTFLPEQRVFIFREEKTFYCIGAICTHLGCTVQLARVGRTPATQEIEFHCPCHGSKFHGDGDNFDGPAPKPLDYYKLELAPDDGQLVVDMSQVADKGWRFSA